MSFQIRERRYRPLTDTECKQKPTEHLRKLSDGGGLQLWIKLDSHSQPSRLWRLAYRFGGKQKLLALGVYPSVSLSDARVLRGQAKRLLAAGIDPSEARRQAKIQLVAATNNTFRTVAEAYVAKLTREGRRPSTLSKLKWLLDFAYPTLGDRKVGEIIAPDILPALRAVEVRGRLETARRLRETIGCVIRFAMAEGKAHTDPTIALRGSLARPKHKPRAAVTEPAAFGALLRAIDGFDGQPTTHAALKLMALLFPRPGEMRAAEWAEFNLKQATWTIPATRTKMKREHRVPLSLQALTILNGLQSITGKGRLLFPSVRTVKKPISETTLNAALRRMGYGADEATSHGFRATASTLLNESGKWNADAIERQLAHVEANNVRRAYARGEHWDERVRMMQWWANYLDELKAGTGHHAEPPADNGTKSPPLSVGDEDDLPRLRVVSAK
jgi:integrase